mmetsp:Transcript_28097/g.83956  ORF Transcript_28097/g.83956 Transcript_28097/m.83956 type:complete len:436 (-) Transcript_28097:124-1431(-)|eukprot:CAMPEP_0206299366 /NCGR_PEP_ID=MMETSP0106_2-20121207/7153_1 /ASSEMBLY_ACC=CAM_ASM_000206 /TAXON_ID=81532 /ORGANISM="Acanthoeca-like sp., Strain 10tr" /LENGTH=435 /DNA_ID=CAMNT_0053730065 /DNA_START=46 /DNA_END=1356 /DNA_ORIENTATION=+
MTRAANATLGAATLLLLATATSAEWITGSANPTNWVHAVNRKRCLHNGYNAGANAVVWSNFLYTVARDAADTNSICSSSDVSFVYLQNSTAATNPDDASQVYAGFSFHIEPGVRGSDTAAKVIEAWYSDGLAECSGATGSGLMLPGCVDNDGGTAAPTAQPTVAGTIVSTADSTDTADEDIHYAFMGMMSAATRYMGCYRCSEGAADASSASYNSLRVICAFKGVSDSCSDINDCGNCHDWEEVSCHPTLIPAVNTSTTEGDCTVSVEALPVLSLPSNASKEDEPVLTDEAISLITVAALLFLVVVAVGYTKREWIRVHVFGRHSTKYVSNKKAAQKANAASVRATMRSVREVQSKRVGTSMRHPATDEIFNPKFSIQESSNTGKSMSALDQLDRRATARKRSCRGVGGDEHASLIRRTRVGGAAGDPSIGDAAF